MYKISQKIAESDTTPVWTLFTLTWVQSSPSNIAKDDIDNKKSGHSRSITLITSSV